MSDVMQAVIKRDTPWANLEEIAVPHCGDSDVLVEVLAAGICGSDIHRYRWEPSRGAPNFKVPLVMGHEFCGRVIEVGSQVTHVQRDQLITAETHIPCGHCYQCETGDQHICANVRVLGLQADGCFAKYAVLPAICARFTPKELAVEEATLLEPLGVAYHAVSLSDVSGDTVAIIGCGTIGLFAVQVAKVLGSSKVIAIDQSNSRLEWARHFGADEVLNVSSVDPCDAVTDITEGIGVGTVIEASGAVNGFQNGLMMARRGGTLVAVGMVQQPVELDVPLHLVRRSLAIRGMWGRRMFSTWRAVTALVKEKRFNLQEMITAKLPLSDYEQGFAMAQSGDHIKVLLVP
jgi:threonine 3-dehydrogenase